MAVFVTHCNDLNLYLPHAILFTLLHWLSAQFFLHSTQLSQVLDKYDTCFANITATTKVLTQKKEALPDLLTAFCEVSTTIEVLFDHELQLTMVSAGDTVVCMCQLFWRVVTLLPFNTVPNLCLKQLVVSRLGYTHEMQHVFCHEGINMTHNLGFTMAICDDLGVHGWLPIPKPWQFGLNHGLESLEEMDSEKEEADWVDIWKEHPGTEDSVDNERPEPSSPFKRSMRQRPLPRKEHEQLLTSTKCEMFPFQRRLMGTMDASGEAGVLPLHMCLQPAQPFMRPHDGIDFAHLGIVYSNIMQWCSCLKAINTEIADAQSAGYGDIADGVHIKGWLMIGHGLQHVCGMQLIEGMVKEDIRWDVLQNKRGVLDTVVLWCLVGMAAILFAAGSLHLTAAGSVVNDVLSSVADTKCGRWRVVHCGLTRIAAEQAKGRGGTHIAFAARGPQGSRRRMDPVQRIGVRVLSSTGVNEEMEVCGEAEVQETAEAEEGCGEGAVMVRTMDPDKGMHHAMADEPKTRKQWAAARPVTVAINSMPAQDTVLPAQSNMEFGLRFIVKDSVKEVVYLSNNRTAECKSGILGANSQSVLTLNLSSSNAKFSSELSELRTNVLSSIDSYSTRS
ncbi:hypothetical protein B0H10DRAFT_2215093 [Mycena sp. CBHHK59/15]|nr:hypothetical protein B0H10DRAFT_2215093 [Mycena sp. CBHHK59/15]